MWKIYKINVHIRDVRVGQLEIPFVKNSDVWCDESTIVLNIDYIDWLTVPFF